MSRHLHTYKGFLKKAVRVFYRSTNLRRWEVCGHGVPERGSEKSAAQDGAHVVRHGFLLLHTAVVLQGQDDRIVRRLSASTRNR